jgi:hypothetical protein
MKQEKINMENFVNTSISSQIGTFTATFDATLPISTARNLLFFSNGAQTSYAGGARRKVARSILN